MYKCNKLGKVCSWSELLCIVSLLPDTGTGSVLVISLLLRNRTNLILLIISLNCLWRMRISNNSLIYEFMCFLTSYGPILCVKQTLCYISRYFKHTYTHTYTLCWSARLVYFWWCGYLFNRFSVKFLSIYSIGLTASSFVWIYVTPFSVV